MAQLRPRIIGSGWAVPKKIRYNDDPIFDWLRKNDPNPNLFTGYKERHVLSDNENLLDMMLPAARKALKHAGKKPEDIDILIGLGSISEFIQPNTLSGLHKALGLPDKTWVIPVGNDFSNFASCLMIADSLVSTKRAKNVLICLGCNWTRNVDYHTGQSVSAADGAGAAVVSMSSKKEKWWVADYCTVTKSDYYGDMYSAGLKLTAAPPISGYDTVYSPHFFQITPGGLKGFSGFGEPVAISSTTKLLKKNKLPASDILFMPHQTSATLINYWVNALKIKPEQVISTLEKFANVTVATHALNFAWSEEHMDIQGDNIVMLALGPDMHANSMLLKRN